MILSKHNQMKRSYNILIVLSILMGVMFMTPLDAKKKGDSKDNPLGHEKSLRDVYVFSKKASLYEEPNVKSNQIKTINSGDVITVYKEKGYWLYVKTSNESGWISKFLVSEYKPRDAKVKMAQIKKTLKRNARRRASSYSSAAAARGLSENDTVTGSIKEDLKAIEQVEKQKISEKELKEFMEKGNLNKD